MTILRDGSTEHTGQEHAHSTDAGGAGTPPARWRRWLARFSGPTPEAEGLPRLSLRQALVTLVYPPQCIACETATQAAQALCPACWAELPLISAPYCARLGTPFAVDFGAEMLSPAAIADPPRFDRGRAVARHAGKARELVSRFKYGERLDLARLMARMMTRAGHDVLAEADVIVPVPMHRLRLWRRRYNQAAVLANLVGEISGVEVIVDGLARNRRTRAQVGLRRAERQKNLAGALEVSPAHALKFHGRRVVVIDDVRTTGATLNACAHILRKAGATRIDVLTFTLVVPGEDNTL